MDSEWTLKALKYGVPGLVLVLAFFAGSIVYQAVQRDGTTQGQVILAVTFMAFSLVLFVLSLRHTKEAIEGRTLDRIESTKAKERADERRLLIRMIADRIKGFEGVAANKGFIFEDPNYYRKVSDQIHYRSLRLAVFENLFYAGGKRDLISEALDFLPKIGYRLGDSQKENILKEFDYIRSIRIRWLEQEAIPAFHRYFDRIQQQQVRHAVPVKAPKDFEILSDDLIGGQKLSDEYEGFTLLIAQDYPLEEELATLRTVVQSDSEQDSGGNG